MVNKVMVSFPEEFLEEVDRIADEEHRSRSELVREALRFYISYRRGRMRPGEDPRVQQAVQIQNRLSTISPGLGEDSAIDVRGWREHRSGFE